ncbi:hypothetical protein SAMN05216420_10635 [Nitrosospira sp. Nl5]|uniref:hypothetical protein n=1 Tax=Nitrosospira sp. Nl5 TaxID=200120 RepID=UPI0008848EA3|nr:hypothetical protein [Nitrosospira sp. Nl5]SCY42382.1 hypothetical protein SAMN05216420_10635 [Nitrosospira sp. Nl5]
MSLKDLIRGKKAHDKFATATPATFATPTPEERQAVATVATVAVAIPADPIPKTLVSVGTSDTAIAYHWWRFHYSNREPKEASYWPPVNEAEALVGEPDAISAEPFEPVRRQPDEPLTEKDEALIRVWLARINETDDETIQAVLDQCRGDADARASFIRLGNKGDNQETTSEQRTILLN